MKRLTVFIFSISCVLSIAAQKKILDHSVYDSWQAVNNLIISKDGKWVAYNINVQEGDDELVLQSCNNSYKKIIPRGYDAAFTGDNKSIIFKIKPLFKDLRQARIKKKKPEDMPKDSLGVMQLGMDGILKFPDLLSYKMPKEANEWVAALLKNQPAVKEKNIYKPDKTKDSLKQVIDSLQYVLNSLKSAKGENDKDSITEQGRNNRLLLLNTANNNQQYFINVSDYQFNKKGTRLLLQQTLNLKDSIQSARIVLYDVNHKKTDTLIRGGNDFKSLAISDDGSQVAFAAERDAKPKALNKFYKIWHYKTGMDSAVVLVDTISKNFPKGYTVSEFGKIVFTKSGVRLLFGTTTLRPPKDTSLVDIDKVNVDIWNYKDDYLQPFQLENKKRELEKSYLAVYDFIQQKMIPLGNQNLPTVYDAPESDGRFFIAITDTSRRVESQWTGSTKKDIYKIDVRDGKLIAAVKNLDGDIRYDWFSPSGKYILWYSNKHKNYFTFDGANTINITSAIKTPLYDEENDVPDAPSPYGIMGWQQDDAHVYIYDRYDIWLVDPAGKKLPINITGNGRKTGLTYRYIQTDPDEKYITPTYKNLLSTFDNNSKKYGLTLVENNLIDNQQLSPALFNSQPYYFGQVKKAKDAAVYAYTKENYQLSPDVYTYENGMEAQLSSINTQQKNYNWGTAALYTWKTFSGKPATGILYKPENYDPAKKYPVILYFYEKLSDNLYRYTAPSPTPSRLNIPFFVSRGYVVMTPDISYTIGHPAKSAYDYIVSGAKSLTQFSWIDAKHMGIQGQSWGGIQVAQLITMTDMFAAAWAGAPVANMTSAYGGIRWQSGVNRQFQYEKTQSRIGATLWEKPELYIENSPLFHLPKVKTPLVIMANDNDGAVPWYQGIELFTAMRRLGKKVWMLNYNGEDHNLIQRKNRKDIQIREQQYFDWLLKGDKPAKWLTEGVPAVDKGINWGLETVQ